MAFSGDPLIFNWYIDLTRLIKSNLATFCHKRFSERLASLTLGANPCPSHGLWHVARIALKKHMTTVYTIAALIKGYIWRNEERLCYIPSEAHGEKEEEGKEDRKRDTERDTDREGGRELSSHLILSPISGLTYGK